MRKRAKLLANFLGATKELTGEYVELAEITERELGQIQHAITSRVARADLPRVARWLKEEQRKTTREIAETTGWSVGSVAAALKPFKSEQESFKSEQPRPSKTGGREAARALIAANAAAGGVTAAPE